MKKILFTLFFTHQLSAQIIPQDKLLHLVTGLMSYTACISFTDFSKKECLLFTASLALGKEAYDLTGRGTPEVLDAAATVTLPIIWFTEDIYHF